MIKVLKNGNLLRKITLSEKYSWYDHGEIQPPSYLHNFLYGLSLMNNVKLNMFM
jgi:hypothetical protein